MRDYILTKDRPSNIATERLKPAYLLVTEEAEADVTPHQEAETSEIQKYNDGNKKRAKKVRFAP